MIKIINVCKSYGTRVGKRKILDNISFEIRAGEKIGILGRNGAGKSTLIRLIGGTELPDEGKIVRNMSVSWPLSFSGGLQNTLTGLDNCKFIARVYGKEFKFSESWLQETTGLDRYLYEPVLKYSTGMRTRLGLAISMMIDFDCYLVDEALAVGDKAFTEQYKTELESRNTSKALLLVSHNERQIKQHCEKVLVLNEGKLLDIGGIKESFEFYNSLKLSNPIEPGI